jgi:hypothetical protein
MEHDLRRWMRLVEMATANKQMVLADMLSRAPKDFMIYLKDLYDAPDELKAVTADKNWLIEEFETWLNRENSMSMRDDALIEFWKLLPGFARMIGQNEVALFHYTSSRVVPSIKRSGLDADRKSVNGTKFRAVFLTAEQSGPPVRAYVMGALRGHGGKPVRITVRMRLSELAPDPDDADIQSGGHQFIVNHIGVDRIVATEPWSNYWESW